MSDLKFDRGIINTMMIKLIMAELCEDNLALKKQWLGLISKLIVANEGTNQADMLQEFWDNLDDVLTKQEFAERQKGS